MATLLMGVFKAVIPFLCYFCLNVVFFAMMSANLGSNFELANGYSGASTAFGYFFQTFENGIGNISAPTISYLSGVHNNTPLDTVITSMIYGFWWFSQVMLLIVLLNFVIALISQYYEDVMNRRVMHTYVMKMYLNHEHNIFTQFRVRMG